MPTALPTATPSRTPAGSCVRNPHPPFPTKTAATAPPPASRSIGLSLPVNPPKNDFRETPTKTGHPPNSLNLSNPCSNAKLCSKLFPNPIPGSTQIRSRPTPAISKALTRSAKNLPTSPTTSSYIGSSCIVCGVPRICIATTPQSASATTSTAPLARKPLTSLTIAAPFSSAAAITLGFIVSAETAIPRAASPAITGKTLRFSSSSETPKAPGRVDSPPTSTTSAPASQSRAPREIAASASAYAPPSENESGVTFKTPITIGRASENRNLPQTQNRSAADIRAAPQ